MKIGIDARLIEETGVGRYIRNLIKHLGVIDTENHYVIFLRRKSYSDFSLPNDRFEKRLADVSWHSIAEQFLMPWYLVKEHLDLVHIPYFNAPIFYPGTYIITIHDLTILHFDTGKATTLPLGLYKLRRLGYYLALAIGLRRAANVIAVSHTTKQEIMDHFQINSDKIVVTHEGVDEKVISDLPAGRQGKRKVTRQERLIRDPYFLYVGNAYPHKNLELLLNAFQTLRLQPEKVSPFQAKLVLVGKDDFFYKGLRKRVENMSLSDWVIFFGPASDDQLRTLYKQAIALVFPSLMEGFGLPALEALALGCPVIVSDIPVFHEILGDQATYFNPTDPQDLTEKLINVVKRPKKSLDIYSWSQLASDTLAVYESRVSL